MNCPNCGERQLNSCIDSRPRNGTIYRRRKCIRCGFRWSTFEVSFDEYNKLKQKEYVLSKVHEKIGRISDFIEDRAAGKETDDETDG